MDVEPLMAVDYEEDYLQKLISAKFGSNWVALFADLKTPSADPGIEMSVDVSFPDQAGGTPGFHLIDLNVPLSTLKPAPYRLTTAGMQAPLRTLAGAGLTGFGVRGFPNGTRGTVNAALYIKLNDAMPKSPFRIRIHYFTSDPISGTGDIERFDVATIKNMKAAVINTFLPDALGTQVGFSAAVTNTFDPDRTFDFRVHPDTLLVDAAVG